MQCGHKATFQVTRPNFCPNCSVAFNRAPSVSTAEVVRQNATVDDDEDDDDLILGEFDKEKLSRAWVAESDNYTRPTFGDLINNPVQRSERTPRPESEAGLSGNDLLKKIRTECARPKAPREVV